MRRSDGPAGLLLGVAVQAEILGVIAAEHDRQRTADIAHVQPEIAGLAAVEHDRSLRLVEKDELSGS